MQGCFPQGDLEKAIRGIAGGILSIRATVENIDC